MFRKIKQKQLKMKLKVETKPIVKVELVPVKPKPSVVHELLADPLNEAFVEGKDLAAVHQPGLFDVDGE